MLFNSTHDQCRACFGCRFLLLTWSTSSVKILKLLHIVVKLAFTDPFIDLPLPVRGRPGSRSVSFYTKGVAFLSKVVYKRVMGWTAERSFFVQNSVALCTDNAGWSRLQPELVGFAAIILLWHDKPEAYFAKEGTDAHRNEDC